MKSNAAGNIRRVVCTRPSHVRISSSVEGARKSFGSNVVDDMLGKRPAYVEALQFEPSSKGVADADTPVIPGSPKRAIGEGAPMSGKAGGDGEILGFVGAVHENEILAAAVAARKKTSQAVVDYATFLHKEHGMSLVKAMELGEKINVTPLETAPVDQLRVKGAGELAGLVPLACCPSVSVIPAAAARIFRLRISGAAPPYALTPTSSKIDATVRNSA